MADAVEQRACIFRPDLAGNVPFVDGNQQRAPFLDRHAGDLQVLVFQPLGRIEQQHHHLGEVDSAARIGDGELFQLVLHLGALSHAGRVDQANVARLAGLGVDPLPVDRDGIAGDARFRPRQQPVLP